MRIDTTSPEGNRPLIPDEREHWRSLPLVTLHVMLQRERQKGEDGHWTYDLARHEAMLKVYRERKLGTPSYQPATDPSARS